MNDTTTTAETFEQALRRLVASDLLELAFLHEREISKETLDGLLEVDYPFNLGLQIDGEGERSEQVCELMRTAIRDLADADEARVHELAADFAGIYLNHSFGVSPCESVWFDEDGLVYQEPMFQAREIYRHYGLEADDWRRRSEDHLVLQLLFVSHLMNVESENALRDAATFLDEHTLRWVDKFAERVATRCDTQFYAGLALLTSAYLNQLRDCLADDILHEPRPTAEEVDARLAFRTEHQQQDESDCGCGPLGINPRDNGAGPKRDRRRYP